MKKNLLPKILLFLFITFSSTNLFAEGSKEMSPTVREIASLAINSTTTIGAYYGAAVEDQIRFVITDDVNENFYFGVGNTNTGGSVVTNVSYRILDSANNVVLASTALGNSGNITGLADATAGPNIAGTAPSGYIPIVFNPTYKGIYHIEFTQGAATNIYITFYDFTVATAAGVRKTGRVFAEKWSIRATAPTAAATPTYPGNFPDSISGALFTYTDDGTIVKVDYNSFQPLQFIPAFNKYGVNSADTNWLSGRRSINSGTTGPTLVGGYKTFLNVPDTSIFKVAQKVPGVQITSITGCPGNYQINYNLPVAGDIRLLFDLNSTAGYQPKTIDRIFEKVNAPIGPGSFAWDGNNGLGVLIPPGTNLNAILSALRGRVNMPAYDAELNKLGFTLSSVLPTAISNLRAYWDDSTSLTNITGGAANLNNTTGKGINNSFVGQISPAHAWDGNGDTVLLTPPLVSASATGGGFTPTNANDDFGNLRTINTWFWVLEETGGTSSITMPTCITVTGSLFFDNNALDDNTVNGTGTNVGGTMFATIVNTAGVVIATTPISAAGTYTFNNVPTGSYTVSVSNVAGTVGSTTLPPSTLPAGYNYTGDNVGTSAGNDNTPNGSLAITAGLVNLADVNFGINNLYVVTGNVFNDVNGLTNNIVDGTGTNAGGLTAILVDSTGKVVDNATVDVNGNYTFKNVPNGNYTVRISTVPGSVGNLAVAPILPPNYASTGEYNGTGAGSDATPNSISAPFILNNANVANINFGIEELPTANTASTAPQLNPGGTNTVVVPANTFGGTDPSGGIITSLTITSFPANATSIIVDGITYTSANFPAGGILVPTSAIGEPTVAISVDPVAGDVTVDIPYFTTDNAGKNSPTLGQASLPFTTATVQGTVFNDVNGTTDNTVNGTGTNAGGLFAILVDAAGKVVASVPVAANGTYTFSGVEGGNYAVKISTVVGVINDTAAASLPANYINTAENNSTAPGSDGAANGASAPFVVADNVANINFGIEELPNSIDNTLPSQTNPVGTTNVTVPSAAFAGTDPSSGVVSFIRITSLPTNATSITINGTTYTPNNWPINGVVIPTLANGNPTQSITIDPIDGNVIVEIPFVSIDEAGLEDPTPASIKLPFVPQIAIPDVNQTFVNVPVSGNVSTNDKGIFPGSTYGNPAPNPANPGSAIPSINTDGTYTFTSPIPGVFTFKVPVTNPNGNIILVDLVITVLDPEVFTNNPVANIDITTTLPATPVTLQTLANDFGGNANVPLDPTSVVITAAPKNGTAVVDAFTGNITYTPSAGFVGKDTLYYTVLDVNGKPASALQIITVLEPGAPNSTTAADDYNAGPYNTPQIGNVIVNDSDPQGDVQSIIPQTTFIPGKGTLVLVSNGSYTFTPVPGFVGPVEFPYSVFDVNANADTAKATLHILIAPPVLPNPDVNQTYVNVPVTGNVSTNDNIPAGSTYSNPAPNPGNPGSALPTINPDGSYTFTSSVPGVFTFKVPITLPNGEVLLVDLVITVLDPNTANPPVANVDITTTPINTSVTLQTLENDFPSNLEAPLVPSSVVVTTAPKNGTTVVDPTTGNIVYTPTFGFVGLDTLFYTVLDADGLPAVAMQIITINAPSAENTTVAADDYIATPFNTKGFGNALNNDSDPQADVQTAIPQTTTIPGKGTLQLLADGSYTFTPVPGFSGPVEFPYTVYDNNANPDTVQATIHILVAPPAPATNPDVNATWANAPVTGNVSTNDQNIPTGSIYSNPAVNPLNPNGATPTINPDGTYTFVSSVPGVYYFNVPTTLPNGKIILTVLQITVLDTGDVNNPPAANTDLASTPKNTPVTLPTLANDGTTSVYAGTAINPTTVTIVVNPRNGTVTVDPINGNTTYTPNAGFVGKDTLFYQVLDSLGQPAVAMQIITIVDTAVTGNTTSASDDFNPVNSYAPVTGNALTNDIDAEKDALEVIPQNITIPNKGTLVLLSDGSYTFTPVAGFVGPINFPYSIIDARGATAKATIYFLVDATGSPLEVSLQLFGKVENSVNALTWIALDENLVTNYQVQKLEKGNFITIQTVTANNSGTYTAFHNNSNETVFTYQIVATEANGNQIISNRIVLKKLNNQTEPIISPNPATEVIEVNFFSQSSDVATIKVIDIAGKIVSIVQAQASLGENTITVDLQNLATGLYTIRLQVGADVQKPQTIQKQ